MNKTQQFFKNLRFVRQHKHWSKLEKKILMFKQQLQVHAYDNDDQSLQNRNLIFEKPKCACLNWRETQTLQMAQCLERAGLQQHWSKWKTDQNGKLKKYSNTVQICMFYILSIRTTNHHKESADNQKKN